jgi:serine/threonine protein kinase
VTVRAGAAAPPVATRSHLPYCAPECVSHPDLTPPRHTHCRVDSAADIWSIGVIAYELLTQQRVLPEGTEEKDVREALTLRRDGVGSLPWERDVSGPKATNRKIPKPLRHAVLACLDRDVENRLSAASMLSLWEAAPWERILDDLAADLPSP